MDALEAGCDVMVFSDNVPVEQEVALKREAAERGAAGDGPGLRHRRRRRARARLRQRRVARAGRASWPRPAPAASSCSRCSTTPASASPLPGRRRPRPRPPTSAGLATREALRRLDEDPAVELIVLVSKPPADDVAAEIRAYAAGLATRCSSRCSGPGQPDLTEATEALLRRPRRRRCRTGRSPGRAAAPSGGHLLRGLFAGGTLCDEARIVADRPCIGPASATRRPHRWSTSATTRYTAGRAHPMIDPTLRLERIARAAADPDTAVLLLDVVLGHGAEPDPAAAARPGASRAVAQARRRRRRRHRRRPAGPATGRAALAEAGAEVLLSNARRHPARRRAARRSPMSTAERRRHRRRRPVRRRARRPGRAGHPGRLAAADGGHRGRPRDGGRRPAPARGQRPGARGDARGHRDPGRRRPGVGGARPAAAASSCTPARRSSGSARPGRCAAR